jgi:hypothetical protein
MEKEFILIKMEIFMKENIKMIMLKEKVFFIIKMEIEMRENLKLENLLEFI